MQMNTEAYNNTDNDDLDDDFFEEAVFEEIFTDKLEFLSVYKMQRSNEFPGVPIRYFTDWRSHREWMRAEREKQVRKASNLRIQADIDQAIADELKPQGD